MAIKANINNAEKEIEQIKNSDEQDIDYVYSRIGDTEVEGELPISIKSIGGNLTDYRIYGNTSKNILPLSKTPKTETIGDILCEYDGKGTFKFTSNVDNPTYTQDQWFWVPFEEDFDFPVGISDGGHGCIQLNNDFATGYGVTPYFVGFANRDNGEFVSGFNVAGTALNVVDTNYYTEDLEGLPANCIAFQYLQQIGKRTVTIKPALYLDIRTQQPFEPYGESVGDRTVNLFDINSPNVQKKCYYDATGQKQNSTYHDISDFIPCGANNSYTLSFRVENDFFTNYGIFVNLWDNQKNFVSNLAAESVRWPNDINKTMQYNITPLQDGYITFNYLYDMGHMSNIMLVEGSTALPYEPYGYKVPVTVSNGTNTLTTPIYLPEQIRKVGDEAEYIDYGEQKFVKKFYKITLNFDDMNNDEIFPGWSGGTAVVEYCNKIRSLAINTPDGYMPLQYSSISNFKAIVNVRNNRSILFLGASFNIGHTQSELKEIYAGRSITFILKIPDTELDVTLPALSTIKGTNTFSVNTSIPPSMYIKDNFDYKKVFTATRTIEGELPLNYRSIEDSDSTLSNYRIYGQTVDGESVGDRTANLFDYTKTNRQIGKAKENGPTIDSATSNYFDYYIPVNPNTTYVFSSKQYSPTRIYYFSSSKQWIGRSDINNNHYTMNTYTFTTPNDCYYIQLQESQHARISERFIMLVEGSTALPYEPYGYRVPVTVEWKSFLDYEATIYLPEPIKMVGDEAEYIDYGEQKMHRVRKNLFDITAQHTIAYETCYQYIISGLNPNLNYTCSTNYNQKNRNDASVYFCGSVTFKNGVWQNEPKTYKPNNNGEVIILIRFSQYCESLPIYDAVVSGDIWIMVNEGDSPLPYEPYIENTDLDVTLPALPTLPGTNTLSVGTEVQPSSVYLKGKLKRTIYGWHVNPDISDSSNAVTYLKDAIGMTPASMGSTTFNYGSW